MKNVDVSQDPGDRLGRIAERMFRALEADPERLDERVIVIITEPRQGGRCMCATHAYEDLGDAMTDLYQHLEAMGATCGVSVRLMAVGEGGGG